MRRIVHGYDVNGSSGDVAAVRAVVDGDVDDAIGRDRIFRRVLEADGSQGRRVLGLGGRARQRDGGRAGGVGYTVGNAVDGACRAVGHGNSRDQKLVRGLLVGQGDDAGRHAGVVGVLDLGDRRRNGHRSTVLGEGRLVARRIVGIDDIEVVPRARRGGAARHGVDVGAQLVRCVGLQLIVGGRGQAVARVAVIDVAGEGVGQIVLRQQSRRLETVGRDREGELELATRNSQRRFLNPRLRDRALRGERHRDVFALRDRLGERGAGDAGHVTR